MKVVTTAAASTARSRRESPVVRTTMRHDLSDRRPAGSLASLLVRFVGALLVATCASGPSRADPSAPDLDGYPGRRLDRGLVLDKGRQWTGRDGGLDLRCAVSAGACLTLIGNYAALRNLPLTFVGTPNQGGVGVQIGAGENGSAPVLRDLMLQEFDTAVDIRSNVSGKLDNVTVQNLPGGRPNQVGIRVRNTFDPDAGDWTWAGVTVSHPVGQGRLVSYESGGGLKVVGFKGLGGTIGWHLNLPDATATQDLQISASSIENASVACMKFERQGGGTKGVFGNISIVGNEFAGCPIGLWFASPGPQGAVVTGNNFSSIAGVPIRLDPGANNIVVGRNTTTGPVLVQDNRTAFSDEYGFLDRSDTVPIDASSTSAWAYAYHVAVPPYRGASIHVVLEGVVQGVGAFTRDEEFLLTSPGPERPLVVTSKSSSQAGVPIGFSVNTAAAGIADIGYRLQSGARLQGTATIVPLGKMVSVSR